MLVVYFLYTLNFAIKFNRSENALNENQKLLHNVFIWLIPFLWITILKTLIQPTPGSDKFKKTKSDGVFYESGIGIFGHSELHNDSHGNDGHGHDSDGNDE